MDKVAFLLGFVITISIVMVAEKIGDHCENQKRYAQHVKSQN